MQRYPVPGTVCLSSLTASGHLQELVLAVVRLGEDGSGERVRHVQGRLALRVAQRGVRTLLQQHHAHVVLTLDARLIKSKTSYEVFPVLTTGNVARQVAQGFILKKSVANKK